MEESALLVRRYEEGLSGYTYLEQESPSMTLEPPRTLPPPATPATPPAPSPARAR
jgi:hypothetical protein